MTTRPGQTRATLITAGRSTTAVGIAALIAVSCAATPEDGHDHDQHGAQPGLAHIHGLGVNPADGQLYVASHHGIFRATGQEQPEQVAGRTQDFMGFHIIGPDHFLASGHPAADDDTQPAHLGLLESTDAAESWQSVSLAGEVDFHALDAARGSVYGYDSQSSSILVSSDQQNWDRRATISAADIAVSPTEPETVLATTAQGVMLSTDGARTFHSVSRDAPTLVFVDWAEADRLVGVGPDGRVHLSEDGGGNWSEQGEVPGEPQSLLAHDESDVYVATASAIHRSTDNGATFQVFQALE